MSELAKEIMKAVHAAIRAYLRSSSSVMLTDPNSGELTTLGSVVNEATTLKVNSLAAEGETGLTGEVEIGVSGGLLIISQAGQVITIGLTEAAIESVLSDYSQTHTEDYVNTDTIVVEHNLGSRPVVQVIGGAGPAYGVGDYGDGDYGGSIDQAMLTPTSVTHDTVNQVTVVLAAADTGEVICVG